MIDEKLLRELLAVSYTHLYCETTTGILNPVKEVCALAKKYEKITICLLYTSHGIGSLVQPSVGIVQRDAEHQE